MPESKVDRDLQSSMNEDQDRVEPFGSYRVSSWGVPGSIHSLSNVVVGRDRRQRFASRITFDQANHYKNISLPQLQELGFFVTASFNTGVVG